ncbi:MAG: FtsQ-type POTRA domain-containing protein [Tepidanaerobacteraceae bacterium]|nr:FtsQ-type POTRA domain-containing protein [Tepidanaerobacteraceae bacterium]
MRQKNKTDYNIYVNRRKRKINYKRLLLSLGFLCIITLMSLGYGSFFTIKEIELKGNNNISTKEILATIDYYFDKNLLAVKSEDVKRSIQGTIPVKDVKVRYKLPHTLIVEVKEREIAAALSYLNGFALIDSNGYVVKLGSKLETYSIPVVTGLEIVNAKVAEKPLLEESVAYFDILLELIGALKPILHELSEINVSVDENDEIIFYLYTLDGYQVLFGELDDKKITNLKDLLDDLRKKGMGKGLLDISHKVPIFKPFDLETGEEKR